MRPFVFLDWFGVIADSEVMAKRWRNVEAKLLQRRYGGTLSHWARVHDRAFRWYLNRWSRYGPSSRKTFLLVWKSCEIGWMKRTLAWGGVNPPKSEKELFRLNREITYEVTRRINPAYRFAREALKALGEAGYRLFLVSGMDSTYVRGVMEATGLGKFFSGAFSPDMLEAFKGSRSYWKKILKLSKSSPDRSVVVDDRPKFLRVPAQLGITPVLLSATSPRNHRFLHISGIRELPRVLNQSFPKS